MNEKKSHIDSFTISMGDSTPLSVPVSINHLHPWDILVCSDLGYTSDKSERISIAEWNEFMRSHNIVISGCVENILSPGDKPLFIEYVVASMKDFSPDVIKTKISAFSGYAGLLDSLARLLDGKIGKDETLSALRKASLPQHAQERISKLFGLSDSAPRTSPDIPDKSALASILSMVDIVPVTSDEEHAPRTAIDGLLTSLSDDKGSVADKAGCAAYIKAGAAMLDTQISALQTQPFFASKKASWQCLMHCVKAIGRKKEVRLSVFSVPEDDRDAILDKWTVLNVSPDIIVWDYAESFTNAEIDRLAALVDIADRLKSAVIAPLSLKDRPFEALEQRRDFSPLFQDILFLPYKKLRSMLASRALCLCAPDMNIPDDGIANSASHAVFQAHCCWPMVIRWIEMLACNSDPFATDTSGKANETILPENAVFYQNFSKQICEEAASLAGMTFYNGTPVDATIDRAKAVIEPEVAGTAYSSFASNLLINRVARLAGLQIAQNASLMNKEDLAKDIEKCIEKELFACRICTAPNQISVLVEKDGTFNIRLNSQVIVGEFPAQFSFSLG